MHEVAIVQSLLDNVAEELREAEVHGRVTSLRLSIGRLSGVYPDSVRFAFDLLAPGSVAEGAALEIEDVPARCVCSDCGRATEIERLVGACPACQSGRIQFEGGRELTLDSIEVDEEAAETPGGQPAE